MNMTAALIAGSVLQQLALGFQFKVNPDSRALACHSIEEFKKAYPRSKGGLVRAHVIAWRKDLEAAS